MNVLTFIDYFLDPIVIVSIGDERFLTNTVRICTGDDYHTIPEKEINPRDYREIFKGLKPKDIRANALFDTFKDYNVSTIQHGMLGDFIGLEMEIEK